MRSVSSVQVLDGFRSANTNIDVAVGFLILGLSRLRLATMTVDISFWSLFWPITTSGLGLAFVFVPLSQVALGTLAKAAVGNASGIFNFLRNIGGSIGISWVNTIAQRHLQTHRNDLAHNFTRANSLLMRPLNILGREMTQHVGPRLGQLRTIAITNRGLNAQAQV